jgi:hypothetical protein
LNLKCVSPNIISLDCISVSVLLELLPWATGELIIVLLIVVETIIESYEETSWLAKPMERSEAKSEPEKF